MTLRNPNNNTMEEHVSAKRQQMIDAGTAYLDALVSHDGSAVPLAPDCWRTEEGRNSGLSADAIREGLKGESMHGITGYRDLRWFVDGNDAVAFYLLDAGATVHLVERFRVIDGLIHEIEAIFYVNPETKQDRWPVDPSQVWSAANIPNTETTAT